MKATTELWSAIFSWAFLDAVGVVLSIVLLIAVPTAAILGVVFYTSRQTDEG